MFRILTSNYLISELNLVRFELSSDEKFPRNALNISNVLLKDQKLISLTSSGIFWFHHWKNCLLKKTDIMPATEFLKIE